MMCDVLDKNTTTQVEKPYIIVRRPPVGKSPHQLLISPSFILLKLKFMPWSVCGGQGPCESELRVRLDQIHRDALQIRRSQHFTGKTHRDS